MDTKDDTIARITSKKGDRRDPTQCPRRSAAGMYTTLLATVFLSLVNNMNFVIAVVFFTVCCSSCGTGVLVVP